LLINLIVRDIALYTLLVAASFCNIEHVGIQTDERTEEQHKALERIHSEPHLRQESVSVVNPPHCYNEPSLGGVKWRIQGSNSQKYIKFGHLKES